MYIGNDKITFNFTQINSFQNIIIKELESVIVFGLQKKINNMLTAQYKKL